MAVSENHGRRQQQRIKRLAVGSFSHITHGEIAGGKSPRDVEILRGVLLSRILHPFGIAHHGFHHRHRIDEIDEAEDRDRDGWSQQQACDGDEDVPKTVETLHPGAPNSASRCVPMPQAMARSPSGMAALEWVREIQPRWQGGKSNLESGPLFKEGHYRPLHRCESSSA